MPRCILLRTENREADSAATGSRTCPLPRSSCPTTDHLVDFCMFVHLYSTRMDVMAEFKGTSMSVSALSARVRRCLGQRCHPERSPPAGASSPAQPPRSLSFPANSSHMHAHLCVGQMMYHFQPCPWCEHDEASDRRAHGPCDRPLSVATSCLLPLSVPAPPPNPHLLSRRT